MSERGTVGHLHVVGGGLGGLVSAIAAREAGWAVTVLEARPDLGGRARTLAGSYQANWGPHVVYADGSLWRWLDERGLARPAGRPPITKPFRFRVEGRGRRVPPPAFVRAAWRLRRTEAPVDATFADWATGVVGEATAAQVASAMGVATFDADPGRLSARFVQERLRRASAMPPSVRYLPGGWTTMVERLAGRARDLGVRIETDSKVETVPDGPVVLAVPLSRAAGLLEDPSLCWTGARTALLDMGMRAARGDSFLVVDLDQSGFAETFSLADHSLAPRGEHLVQAQAGLRQGESLEAGVARLEGLLDAGYADWRPRETWRRRAVIENESGALDLPGTTWQDRPAVHRGDNVYVVGDMMAAPGLLGEVSANAAVAAVAHLGQSVAARRHQVAN